MDGASTDDSVDVLRSFEGVPELRWWSEPDSGVVDAVNKGFARAHGEIGAIQSSDDCYLQDAVRTAVGLMHSHPDVGLVYGDIVTVDDQGTELFRTRNLPFTLENLLSKNTWIPQPAAFFRMHLFRTLGGWNEAFFNADTELWFRMAFRTSVAKVDSFLAQRRIHDAQRNRQNAKIVESYWRMIDTSQDIQDSPRRYRKAAQSGKYLHAVRYNPTGRTWMRTYYYWRAALAYPTVLERSHVRHGVMPAYRRVLTLLSRLKAFVRR